MLSEQVTQLLSAYVDGELHQLEREAVLRLLHQSSEARELLRQLQENVHRLKQLPRRKLEPSLVDQVLQAIAAQKMQPSQPMDSRKTYPHWKSYVMVSMAASLLLGVVSFLAWKSLNEPDQITLTKTNSPGEKKNEPRPTPEVQQVPVPRKEPNRLLASMIDGTFGAFGAPIPVEKAFVASFRDLQREGVLTGQLTHELNREKFVQLDLLVKNNSIAMERLKSALHERTIKVIVDPDASKALKKPGQAKVEYLVYAQNLTSDEVTAMLKDLSLNDTRGKRNEPSPYEKLTLAPLTALEKQQLGSTLGMDVTRTDKEPKSNNVSPSKERTVLILPMIAGARASEEIRQFVHQSPRPRAGTVQLLIKIRQD